MKTRLSALLFSSLLMFSAVINPCWAEDEEDGDAYNTATAVEGTSVDAAGYANSDDYESAATNAGAGFDTATEGSPPPVYLNCDPCVVDPNDLKQYDPPEPSLKPSYVPPLPDSM
ncbi:MAG TPA: hypothetical protein PLE99_01050 [Candidatus Thiothrix moscowensis]|mgnify:CR=1 FL=1|uniref:hypothetical protein n=1 Tax=unclassified Thiothrix TaxID=2636184 RepID=UPI001A2CB40E|nr:MULTISPECIES: hypothetical protein [unclassified Thiothrix]MBJ6610122.1 hypothetical protein [Candidatus Thiothrix moscowensis]HRJ51323.1 hypothetical protein [Candidatus Thiothrix moscowensis]HRJ91622.1 hypothetical protein [Candidatus Thiothrix moscowensis]